MEQTYDDSIATLIIKEIKTEDAGEYVCRAKNDEGSDTTSAQLVVRRKLILFVHKLIIKYLL